MTRVLDGIVLAASDFEPVDEFEIDVALDPSPLFIPLEAALVGGLLIAAVAYGIRLLVLRRRARRVAQGPG